MGEVIVVEEHAAERAVGQCQRLRDLEGDALFREIEALHSALKGNEDHVTDTFPSPK